MAPAKALKHKGARLRPLALRDTVRWPGTRGPVQWTMPPLGPRPCRLQARRRALDSMWANKWTGQAASAPPRGPRRIPTPASTSTWIRSTPDNKLVPLARVRHVCLPIRVGFTDRSTGHHRRLLRASKAQSTPKPAAAPLAQRMRGACRRAAVLPPPPGVQAAAASPRAHRCPPSPRRTRSMHGSSVPHCLAPRASRAAAALRSGGGSQQAAGLRPGKARQTSVRSMLSSSPIGMPLTVTHGT